MPNSTGIGFKRMIRLFLDPSPSYVEEWIKFHKSSNNVISNECYSLGNKSEAIFIDLNTFLNVKHIDKNTNENVDLTLT